MLKPKGHAVVGAETGSGAPVKNLFHVSQALSWTAGTRNTIPERLDYVKAIPRLIDPLTSRFVEARQA